MISKSQHFTRSFRETSSSVNCTNLDGKVPANATLGISAENLQSGNGATLALSLVIVFLFLVIIGIGVYSFYRKRCKSQRRSADEEPLLFNSFHVPILRVDEPQQHRYEKPTLGGEWHLEKYIDNKGSTISYTKYDVHLSFPNNTILEGDRRKIFLSIHTDMPEILHTFKVDHGRIIIAPVVECFMPDIKELDKYAILTVPHCVRQYPNNIRVQWFNHGVTNLRGCTGSDVVILKSFDDHKPSMDIFCVDRNDGYLQIYTKHFSTIVCTHHGQIEFDLQASLYGKVGRIDGSQSLHLKLELGGPLMTLKGFWEEHHENMEKIGFQTSENKIQIDLVPEQEEGSVLQFRIGLLGQANKKWTHVQREGTEELVHQIIQTKKLKEILQCQTENHIITCSVQWYLKGSCYKSNTLPIYVDIINIRNMDVHDSEGVEDRRKTTINTEIKTFETSIEKPDFTMKEIFDFLTRRLSSGELKKTVRLLDFDKDFPDIENKTDDEKQDFWFRTLMGISAGREQNRFKDDLFQVLKLVSQPVLEEVRRLLSASPMLPVQVGDCGGFESERNNFRVASMGPTQNPSQSRHDLMGTVSRPADQHTVQVGNPLQQERNLMDL